MWFHTTYQQGVKVELKVETFCMDAIIAKYKHNTGECDCDDIINLQKERKFLILD